MPGRGTAENWGTTRNLLLGARFLCRLPAYLRNPLDAPEADHNVRTRLDQRAARFLELIRGPVLGHGSSPYAALLGAAGFDASDLEHLLQQQGLEATLRSLLLAGVYVTVDEFKGRIPVRRGSFELWVGPQDFRNPRSAYHLPAASGGSRSQGTPVLFDLEFIRACAADAMVVLQARKGLTWEKAVWEVPGGGARFRLLKYAAMGTVPRHWFSQVDPYTPGLHPLYAWSTRFLGWGSRLAGHPFPNPEYCPVPNPEPVLHWVDQLRRAGVEGHLFTFPSSAVALAAAAGRRGTDLSPLHLTISGEPITTARMETLRAAGVASVGPRYGSVETGPIAYGCLHPRGPDDLHLLSDLHALIQAGSSRPEVFPERALLITSLHPKAPFVLLNASMGDEAELEVMPCGCPLEGMGWPVHLYRVRSFEKLTGAGMTFAAADVIRVLEEILPQRFGGKPGDFQLVEQETREGHVELQLLVDPDLGPLEADQVSRLFLESLGSFSIVNRLMGTALQNAAVIKVERRRPQLTRSGKVLHLHVQRKPAP